MNIGQAARKAGLPSKTVRYYDEIGLVSPPTRAENGYRYYDEEAVASLRLVQQARGLGFSVSDCRNLLSLFHDNHRASCDVKALAEQHIHSIQAKIDELTKMRDRLSALTVQCHGDSRPECPILEILADEKDVIK